MYFNKLNFKTIEMKEIEILNAPIETGKTLKCRIIDSDVILELQDIVSGIPGEYRKNQHEKIFIIAAGNWNYLDDNKLDRSEAFHIGKSTTDKYYLINPE